MGERLAGPTNYERPRMTMGHIIICIVFLVVGVVFIGIGVANGEGRLRLKDVESASIHIRATDQVILLSDAERDAFVEVFDGKATYRMDEGETAEFPEYVITVKVDDKTFYVSKDTVTMEADGQGYDFRMLPDEWKAFKSILQGRGVAL